MRASPKLAIAIVVICLAATGPSSAAEPERSGSAEQLRATYAARQGEIAAGGRKGLPLTVRSTQTESRLQGVILALVDEPFDKVREALAKPSSWCEILILHPNVKGCRLEAEGSAPKLVLGLGRAELPADFTFRTASSTADYLDLRLGSPSGPFGTTDYRIRLEAAPLDARHTILHLGYEHGYGLRAKLAMQAYFSTLGRGKVGFSVVEKNAEGKPVYVSDLRGGLERNAMRYYASIESYLESLSGPAEKRLDRRLRNWFAYTERHPLQLQEEPGYLERKRREMEAVGAG